MLYGKLAFICGVLYFFTWSLSATSSSATQTGVVVASADTSANNNSNEDSGEKGSASDHAAAASEKPSGDVARREPEPLTLKGACGLLAIVAAIGGFSWWAMRPLMRKPEDDAQNEDDAQEA